MSVRKAICAVGGGPFWLGLAFTASASESDDSFLMACQRAFVKVPAGGSTRTPGILAPNKRLIAWSEGTWRQTPELYHSALIVRDVVAGRSETVFRTRASKAGRVVGPAGNILGWANADQFCVVDWSRDSRYLLVRELVGPTESDNGIDYVWGYDVRARRRFLIPLSGLRRVVEAHWIRKGLNFGDVDYALHPDGWEDADVPRPAFVTTVLEGSPTSFPPGFSGSLGVWSIDLWGGALKLLSERPITSRLRRYGEPQATQP